MGAADKVTGNKTSGKKRPEENKSAEKKNLEKRTFFVVNHAFLLVRGLFCIKSYWSQKKSPRK